MRAVSDKDNGHNYFFSMSGSKYSDGYDHIFKPALRYLDGHGKLIPPDLLDELGDIGAIKTVNYYTRVLTKAMRDLYNGRITEDEFIDLHAGYLERQLRRAWNEGMRANGLDPKRDMLPEWEQIYQEAVIAEYQYIDRIAAQIAEAARAGSPLDPFIRRAELWANRYTDIVNRAMLETGQSNSYAWRLGATEQHCADCLRYNGQVKTGLEWKQEKQPQSRELECGGWQCDCRFEMVDNIGMLFAPALRNE